MFWLAAVGSSLVAPAIASIASRAPSATARSKDSVTPLPRRRNTAYRRNEDGQDRHAVRMTIVNWTSALRRRWRNTGGSGGLAMWSSSG